MFLCVKYLCYVKQCITIKTKKWKRKINVADVAAKAAQATNVSAEAIVQAQVVLAGVRAINKNGGFCPHFFLF